MLCGYLRAQRGEWAEAANAFTHAAELIPHDALTRRTHALALLSGGREEQFKAACRQMLDRFLTTDNPEDAEAVARTCVLLPGAVSDFEPCLAMARRALTSGSHKALYRTTLGAVLRRVGRYDEAVSELEKLPTSPGGAGLLGGPLLRAMASFQQHESVESRQALSAAMNLVRQALKSLPISWQEKVELRQLLGEADTLLK